jgi:hypothetical protein
MVLASGSRPTTDTQQPLECPLCKNADVRPELRSNNGYPIVRCSRCGLVYTDVRESPAPAVLYPGFDPSDSVFSRNLSRPLGGQVIHFEAKTLDRCLRDAGLTPIRDWSFLPEYGLSGWLQSTLNRIVPHPNYLYEPVKDRGAVKELGVVQHGSFAAVSILAGAPTLALSLPVEALASSFGGGAALTFAAKRAR